MDTRSHAAPLPLYGELEEVGELAAATQRRGLRDPAQRYWGAWRRGRIEVFDVTADELVPVAEFADVRGQASLSPDARRLVVRREGALAIYEGARLVAEARTPTLRLAWNGERLAPGAPPPRWGYADEHLGFTADGRHVWLATHGEDARACVQLYAPELTLVDVFTDLRSYSAYAARGARGGVPLGVWSESWLAPEPHAPGWVLGVCNAGDSCAGVFAFAVRDGRLVVEQEALQRAVFAVDGYFLRALQITPAGELLVVDRDSLFSLLPWPPEPETPPRVRHVDPAARLRGEDHALAVPFFEGAELDIVGIVSVTAEHVLVSVDDVGADDATAALLAAHPATLEGIGLVESPVSTELEHLGHDRFVAFNRRGATVWRLAR